MRRVPIVLVLAFAAMSFWLGPACAAEKDLPRNPTVLMSPVALPIVVDGRVVNYVFVTLRLWLSSRADGPAMQAKEPYFRDALVRAGHRTPFVRKDNYAVLDIERMKAALLNEAAGIVGPGMVQSVQVIRAQPQHYDGLPRTTQPGDKGPTLLNP